MTTNNTIEGIHLFPREGVFLHKLNAKKYYWHIPKALQEQEIQVGSVVRGNSKQWVLVTNVFREELKETGKKYANLTKIQVFEESPTIREATAEELKKLYRGRKKA